MELLIPGLLLVAFMIYASTKIKRIAAEAFDPEVIETDAFMIEKPEEFLNVINHDPKLELEAYSREFGVEHKSEIKQARLEIVRFTDRSLEGAVVGVKDAAEVKSDISEIIDGRKYRLIETERVEKGIGYREFYKLAESGTSVYQLKVIALEDASDVVSRRIEKLLTSFAVK